MYSHAALWDEGSQGKGAAWALGLRGDLSLEVAGLTRALPARMCMGRAKITSDRQGSAIAPIRHGVMGSLIQILLFQVMACLERGTISMVGCGEGPSSGLCSKWSVLESAFPSHTLSSPKSSVHMVWFHTYLVSSLDPRAEQSMCTHFTDKTEGHVKWLRQVTPC